MRRFAKFFLLAVVISTLTPGALAQPLGSSTAPPDTSTQATGASATVVKSCNSLGFKLFRAVAAQKAQRDNVLVSPLSAFVALAMAYNGAAETTRDSIAKAIVPEGLSDSLFNEAIGTLISGLAQADTAVTIDIANSLWYDKAARIKREFVGLCQAYFSADIRRADFHTQAAIDSINHWVKAKTSDQVNSIIDRSALEPLKALLLNVLFFRGDWTFPFDLTETRRDEFRVPGDSAADCYMMYRDTQADWWLFRDLYRRRPPTYFESKLLQGVNLPYGSRGLYMTVLLPDSSSNVGALMTELTEENWRTWQQSPTEKRFVIGLPKFKFECETLLNEALDSLGMAIVFSERADFSNMFSDSKDKISDVRQKTLIEVSERGTEAAAATSVSYPDSIPPSLIANRPFLFLIHDKETGLILFVGKVAHPKW